MNTLQTSPQLDSVPSVRSVLKDSAASTPHADELAETLEHLQLQREHAQAMAQDSPNVFLKAAMNIASVDFFTVLNRFDTDALIKRLHEKPELYFQLINAQVNLMKASLEQQKFEFKQKQAETKQRDREQKLRARKPILLTDDTLDKFQAVFTHIRQCPTQDFGPKPQDSAQKTQDFGLKPQDSPSNLVEFPPQDPWHDPAEEYSDDLVCSSA